MSSWWWPFFSSSSSSSSSSTPSPSSSSSSPSSPSSSTAATASLRKSSALTSAPPHQPSLEDFISFMTNSTLNLEGRRRPFPLSNPAGQSHSDLSKSSQWNGFLANSTPALNTSSSSSSSSSSHPPPLPPPASLRPSSSSSFPSSLSPASSTSSSTSTSTSSSLLSAAPSPPASVSSSTATIGDLPDPESLGRNRLVICVVGRVSTGKSSLVKAFFGIDPEDDETQEIFKVDALAGTTTKAAGVVIELPPFMEGEAPGKVVVFDLPGLHEAKGKARGEDQRLKAVNQNIDAYLKKNVLDVGIFVVDGVVTDTIQADYQRLTQVAKKVFLVWNKIDTLDYLKPEVRQRIMEETRKKLQADRIFPTACKGYDPNAERSSPDWYDVRGVEELKTAVYSFVYEYKQAGFLNQFRLEQFWKGLKQVSYRTLMGLKVMVVEIVANSLFSFPLISSPTTLSRLNSNSSMASLPSPAEPYQGGGGSSSSSNHNNNNGGGGMEDIRVDPSPMLQDNIQPKKRRTESPEREKRQEESTKTPSPRKQPPAEGQTPPGSEEGCEEVASKGTL